MTILNREITFIKTDSELVDMEVISDTALKDATLGHLMCYIYNEGILPLGMIRKVYVKNQFGQLQRTF